MFAPATREQLKLRLAISGPSGSGKTFTALRLAHAAGGKIAYVDTEHRSASKYVGEEVDGKRWAFDVVEPSRFAPKDLADTIRHAERAGYSVLIIDSLTHYWSGPGGVLDIAGGKFTGWKQARPIEQTMWDAILSSKLHIICTMRTKTVYEVSDNSRGRPAPTKVGTDSQQREGAEYEFDIVLRMDPTNTASVDKTRCSALQGRTFPQPGPDVWAIMDGWLSRGSAPEPVKPYGTKMLEALTAIGVSEEHARLYVGAWPPEEWTKEQHEAAIGYLGKRAKGQQVVAVVPSETSDARYILIAKADAPHGVGCDCEAGKHGKLCKHVEAYVAHVAAADEAPAADKAVA